MGIAFQAIVKHFYDKGNSDMRFEIYSNMISCMPFNMRNHAYVMKNCGSKRRYYHKTLSYILKLVSL